MKKLSMVSLTVFVLIAGFQTIESKKGGCLKGTTWNGKKCIKTSTYNKNRTKDANNASDAWNTLSGNGNNIAGVSPTQITGMKDLVARSIPVDQLVQLSLVQTAAFKTSQIQNFSNEQFVAITPDQLNVVLTANGKNLFGTLRKDQVAKLLSNSTDSTKDQVNGLIALWKKSTSDDQKMFVQQLTKDQINGLNNDSLTKIMTSLSITQIPHIDINSISANLLGTSSAEQVAVLTKNQITALTADQIVAIMQNMSKAQIESLTDDQLGTMETSQLQALLKKYVSVGGTGVSVTATKLNSAINAQSAY